ncbi:hypothetical protein JX266_008330 [Neoarthrinium moseri]|nr:hypothetical protein JX266_008330 [Neoarthrinium moseri]
MPVANIVPPVGLDSLPNELLFKIIYLLHQEDVNALGRTCSGFYQIINPELYRRDRQSRYNYALHHACCGQDINAINTLRRVLQYAPAGTSPLNRHFKRSITFRGKSCLYLTPLQVAVQARNPHMLQALLHAGAIVDQPELAPGRHDALWHAIHFVMMIDAKDPGHQPEDTSLKVWLIEILVRAGADPNQLTQTNPRRDPRRGNITPLHLAIANKADGTIIECLLHYGAIATRSRYKDVPNQYFSNVSPIAHFVNLRHNQKLTKSQHRAAVALIEHGAGSGDEATMYTVSRKPLLLELLSAPRACEYWVDIIDLLLTKNGVSVDCGSDDPLILHFLLKHVDWRPVVAYSPWLYLSHEMRNDMQQVAKVTIQTLDVLIRHGADVNAAGSTANSGLTPLHVAVGLNSDFYSIFDFLVSKGAKFDARTADGRTVLHTLPQMDTYPNVQLVSHLIRDRGIDRHAVDDFGNTFLHIAMENNIKPLDRKMAELVKYYTRRDFSKFVNADGKTPYDCAKDMDKYYADQIDEWYRDPMERWEPVPVRPAKLRRYELLQSGMHRLNLGSSGR